MRRLTFPLLFIAVCLSVLLFSCGEEKNQRLLDGIEQTWQQCETLLPGAKIRAEAMKDSVRKSTEYVRQKYDLLSIRLRDKQDEVPSSPDSAKESAAYFARRGNTSDAERAYYYLGSAYRDLKDYPRAVQHFLKAVDVAERGEAADTLIWQNALSQLRHLYMLELNYEEELNAAKRAVELAQASDGGAGRTSARQKNMGRYLMDVASAYKHLDDTLHCLLYCDLAYKALQEEDFPQGCGDVMSYMLALYSGYGHYEKAEPLLRHLSQLPGDRRPDNYELCLAKFHEDMHRTDSAIVHYITYYNKVRTTAGRYEATAGLQRCYYSEGDFRQAAQWGRRLYETNDSIIAQRAFEQTQRALGEFRYHRDMEEEQAIRQRDERIILFSVIGGLAMLAAAMGMAAAYLLRRKRYVEEIVGWKKLLEQKAVMDRELTRMTLMSDARGKAEDLVDRFRNIAEGKAKMTPSLWRDLTAAMESLYPGFLETVQGREPKLLREPLLRTICLLKVGLRPMQIAGVMDAPIQTVWNRVKRAEEICGDLLDEA